MTDAVPGDAHLDRYEIHKRVRDRVGRRSFVARIETEPSPMRPTIVGATIDTTVLFDEEYRPDTATLEFEWRPRPSLDRFRIQYVESDAAWSCGWHQDGSHEALGPNHFQIDRRKWNESHPEPASFDDSNPMAILDHSLAELEDRVPGLPDEVA